jgi:hypothetical protein
MEGRALELLQRGVEALERNAVASEKLIELATEEREVGDALEEPPHCPHCGTFNPDVTMQAGGGSLAKFVLIAMCGRCGEVLFGIPRSWQMARSQDEAKAIIEGREAA